MCYTYDSLDRVVSRVVINLSDNSTVSVEHYTYDAAVDWIAEDLPDIASNVWNGITDTANAVGGFFTEIFG